MMKGDLSEVPETLLRLVLLGSFVITWIVMFVKRCALHFPLRRIIAAIRVSFKFLKFQFPKHPADIRTRAWILIIPFFYAVNLLSLSAL
jgi:hypothetical protein